MFATSTQKHSWTFSNENVITMLREKHNMRYQLTHGEELDTDQKLNYFLTPEEEKILLKNYEIHMKEFCRKFTPPMPKCVQGTSFHYFKRFYLYNSTMDYHPRDILATCVYLACKVEEFNVSITQFVHNIKGDQAKAESIILQNELLLMQQLKYNLTIHNPFRAIEGFLIDIKTRCSLPNPERLRPGIEDFIDRTFFSDVCLLYAPSQIALAAVLHAASKEQENLDSYVTDTLFKNAGRDRLGVIIEAVRTIRSMVKVIEIPPKEKVKAIEKKLEGCRNPEFNPDSAVYKQKMQRLYLDDDMVVN